MIIQKGTANTTALIVPNVYVQIVPPQNLVINGVPTNVVGAVGTASWGAKNTPIVCSSMADYSAKFGPIQNRKFDVGTHVATAVLQGASNFRVVRVTDGTDAAATATLASAMTVTSLYTGSWPNSATTVALAAGGKAATVKVTVATPGVPSEIFDRIPGPSQGLWITLTPYTVGQAVCLGANWYTCITAGTSGATGPTGTGNSITDGSVTWSYSGTLVSFWTAVVAALNTGVGTLRGASQYVTAALATGSSLLTVGQTLTLTGGSDGTTTITAATLVGTDGTTRTGMYALRGQGCSIALLADADDTTQYTTQASFGLSEGIYMILTGPSGDTISNATVTKAAAGLDSYACKLMFGDWLYWNDPVNAVVRVVSPQGFVAGRLANLSPEQSSLNKPLYGVVASQKSANNPGTLGRYSDADLAILLGAGIDVVANPIPAGNIWGVRGGHNSSTDPTVSGDNYTRLTNYVASTVNAAFGLFIGQPINADLFRRVRSTMLSFCQAMMTQGLLGSVDGSLPYSVICDLSNNTNARTALGYLQMDVQIRYMAIAEKFIVNIEGGQTVTIARQTIPNGQV